MGAFGHYHAIERSAQHRVVQQRFDVIDPGAGAALGRDGRVQVRLGGKRLLEKGPLPLQVRLGVVPGRLRLVELGIQVGVIQPGQDVSLLYAAPFGHPKIGDAGGDLR